MAMRRFMFNKLARNKSVKNFEKKGVVCKIKRLTDNEEFLEALTKKIVEELEEVFESQSQEELISELADVEEVFDSFKKLLHITQKEVDAARVTKKAERGDFEERLYVEYADIPESVTDEIEYFESQPDRYPEVDPKTGKYIGIDEDEE